MRAERTQKRARAILGKGLIQAAVVAAALGAAGAAEAQRESGIQLTPDSARYLISKDVGADRWAISYNLNDKTVTGNVLVNGETPQFLACRVTQIDQAPNPADAQYHLNCQFAESCGSAPCANQWGAAFDVPPIPGSFFLPTDTLVTYSGNVQPIFNSTCATSLSCHVFGGAGPVDLSAGVSYGHVFKMIASQDPNKFYVNPFAQEVSYLMNKIDGTGFGGRMPLGGPVLLPEVADQIRTWILEGAANN